MASEPYRPPGYNVDEAEYYAEQEALDLEDAGGGGVPAPVDDESDFVPTSELAGGDDFVTTKDLYVEAGGNTELQPIDPRVRRMYSGLGGTSRTTPSGGYGTMLSMGGKQLLQSVLGVGQLLGFDLAEFQNRAADALAQDYEKLSPSNQRLIDAKWASVDEDSVLRNPEAALAQLTVQMPTLLATMAGPAGLAMRAASVAGKLAVRKGVAEAAVQVARRKAAERAGAIAGGVAEGTITAGASMDQIRQGIKDMPLATLLKSPEFKVELDKANGNELEARESFTKSLRGYAVAAGGATALLGAVAGGYLGRLVAGGAGASRLGNAARAAAVEGPLTESPQELSEAGFVGSALQRGDPTRPMIEDPLESAISAGALGAMPGAAIGAASPTRPSTRLPSTTPPAAPVAPGAAPPAAPGAAPAVPALDEVDAELDAAVGAAGTTVKDAAVTKSRVGKLAGFVATLSQITKPTNAPYDLAPLTALLETLSPDQLVDLETAFNGPKRRAVAEALEGAAAAPENIRQEVFRRVMEGVKAMAPVPLATGSTPTTPPAAPPAGPTILPEPLPPEEAGTISERTSMGPPEPEPEFPIDTTGKTSWWDEALAEPEDAAARVDALIATADPATPLEPVREALASLTPEDLATLEDTLSGDPERAAVAREFFGAVAALPVGRQAAALASLAAKLRQSAAPVVPEPATVAAPEPATEPPAEPVAGLAERWGDLTLSERLDIAITAGFDQERVERIAPNTDWKQFTASTQRQLEAAVGEPPTEPPAPPEPPTEPPPPPPTTPPPSGGGGGGAQVRTRTGTVVGQLTAGRTVTAEDAATLAPPAEPAGPKTAMQLAMEAAVAKAEAEAVKEAEQTAKRKEGVAEAVKKMGPGERIRHAVTRFFTIHEEAAEEAGVDRPVGERVADTGTKDSPATILRKHINRLVAVAQQNGYAPTRKALGMRARAPQTGAYMAEFLRELRSGHPALADAISSVIEGGDIQRVGEVFDDIEAFMQGDNTLKPTDIPLLGTPFERIESQFRRAIRRATTLGRRRQTRSGKPYGVPQGEFSRAVQDMYSATRRLLREMAALTNSNPQVVQLLLLGELREVLVRNERKRGRAVGDNEQAIDTALAQLVEEANAELDPTGKNKKARIDLSVLDDARKIWSSPDPIAKSAAARKVFDGLVDLVSKLEKVRAFKLVQERDARVAEIGFKSAAAKPMVRADTPQQDIGKLNRTAKALYTALMSATGVNQFAHRAGLLAGVLKSMGASNDEVRSAIDGILQDRAQLDAKLEGITEEQRERFNELNEDMRTYVDDRFGDEYIDERGDEDAENPLSEREVEDVDADIHSEANEQRATEMEVDAEKRWLNELGITARGRPNASSLVQGPPKLSKDANAHGKGRRVPVAQYLKEQRAKARAEKTAARKAKQEAKRLEKEAAKAAEDLKAEQAAQQEQAAQEEVAPPETKAQPTVKQRRARTPENLARALNLTTLPLHKFLLALQRRYTKSARAAKAFFATFNQKNSDSVIMAGFINSLTAPQLRDFAGLVDQFVATDRAVTGADKSLTPRDVKDAIATWGGLIGLRGPETAYDRWRNNQRERARQNPALAAETLKQDRQAVIDFVKSFGLAVPESAQFRVIRTIEGKGPASLDLDAELMKATLEATPPGTPLPESYDPRRPKYTPAQREARAAAKKRVEAFNEQAKREHVTVAPMREIVSSHATREEAEAAARMPGQQKFRAFKPGLSIEAVTMESVVSNYIDAMREVAVEELGVGALTQSAGFSRAIKEFDEQTVDQAGGFIGILQRVVASFVRQNDAALQTSSAILTNRVRGDLTEVQSRTLLTSWLEHMAPNAQYRPLVQMMLSMEVEVPIVFMDDKHFADSLRISEWEDDGGTLGMHVVHNLPFGYTAPEHAIYMPASAFARGRPNKAHVGMLLRVLMHELVHGYTIRLLNETESGLHPSRNRAFNDLKALYDIAKVQADKKNLHYGLKNLHEFVAELWTNPDFAAFLQSISLDSPLPEITQVKLNLFQRIINVLSRFLYGSERFASVVMASVEGRTVFEEAIAQSRTFFADQAGIEKTRGRLFMQNVEGTETYLVTPEPKAKPPTLSGAGSAAPPPTRTTLARGINRAKGFSDKLQQGHLGFMNLDFMERKYRQLGDKIANTLALLQNPITRLVDAVTRTSKLVRDIGDAHVKLTERTQKLTHEQREALYTAMIEATYSKLNVDAPGGLLDPSNKHIFTKKGKYKDREGLAAAMRAWKMLDPDTKALYSAWREHLSKSRALRIGVLAKNAAKRRGMSDAEAETLFNAVYSGQFDPDTTVQQLPNTAQLEDKELEDLAKVVNEIFDVTKMEGPYFPLRREGDYVVTIKVEDQKNPIIEFYDSRADAEEAKAEYEKRGHSAIITHKIAAGGSAEGSDMIKVAQEIIGRIRVPASMSDVEADMMKEMEQQFYNATIKLLADRVMYGSQLRRKNIRGTQTKDMAKSLEDYSRASISAISAIDSMHDYTTAMRDIRKAAVDPDFQEVSPTTGSFTQDEQLLIGSIYNELVLRAHNLATDRDVTRVDQILGSIGFFTYLGAPAYWLVNATQTAVVGAPVMASIANVSLMKSIRSLTHAYGKIKKLTKGMGFRALTDLQAVVAKLPPDQRDIMLQLIDDNAIQSTLAFETNALTRLNSGFATSKVGKVIRPVYNFVTDILQVVPDMIERFNRMSMALAAMDLGITNYTQIKDIVLSSQFNYDPANRARLLKYAPKMLGGGMRQFWAPMMMFKVFGVNMAELIYGNMYDGFISKAKTPEEKKQARRTLYGLIGTHTAFGGVYGGLGLGLGQVVVGAINSMLDDEDKLEPSRYLNEFLTEATGDYMASIITRGLPAAFGLDLSASNNLGNLVLMNRDNDWSEYGGIEQSVYGLLGPVAQYGAGAIRSGAQMLDGEASVAEFLEKSVPLKAYRGLSQMVRTSVNGLETRQGQQFLSEDEFGIGSAAITALGLRSTAVTRRQEQFYADRNWSAALENRKAALMKELATAPTPAARNEARREQQEWNRHMRQLGNRSLVITASSIERSRDSRGQQQERYREGRYTEYAR